jgi:hypothetical protein
LAADAVVHALGVGFALIGISFLLQKAEKL